MCLHKLDGKSTIIIVYTYEYSTIDKIKHRINDYSYCYLCGKKFPISP